MSGMTKAQRLEEMKRLYTQRAWSDIEMAERLGVDRTLVYRDRIELTAEYPIEKDQNGRYYIPRAKLISEVKLNLHQALALYLAARRTVRQTRFHHPHAANAVEKLAATLRQPMTEKLLKAADRLLKQEENPEKIKILETIAQAWVEQRKVRIEYQPLGNEGLTRHTISPYIIEPSIWSDSVYVIAKSDFNDKIFAFKIERILSAFLSGETFEIPASFDDEQLLRHAWGIWFADRKPVTVKLRFAPNPAVIQRLEESIWHPLERVEKTEDGGRIWSVEIAEPREMLPWIRGWGADCEVLEPKELREALEKEARRLARVYGVGQQEDVPAYFHLWAKSEKYQFPDTHPLIYHLLDVGECALALWKHGLSEQARQSFSQRLNLDVESAGRLLAFWAALHDLGKAAPEFQRKYEPRIPILERAGFAFPSAKDRNANPPRHGILSTWALDDLLAAETGLSPRLATRVAAALGGHHGVWPLPNQLQSPVLQPADKGDETWNSARKQIFLALKEIYSPPEAVSLPKDREAQHAFLSLLSGLVSVADWIGSMEKYFPFRDEYLSPAEYAQKYAAPQAEMALKEVGWAGWHADGEPKSFDALFPKTPNPNEIQRITLQQASDATLPALLILEAPTGIGKTEAALALADAWLQRQRGSGLYVAMPTQATSNQMYGRVVEFLRSRYPEQAINAHLIHGGALLAEEQPSPRGIAQDEITAERGVKAESWFLPRKRTLLAPFGVGTVDQALMSVLQTRHFFVRLFGLGHKVVVFDEIHAYDTYMSELFQRLLHWLRAMGTSAILLSATLPEKTRRALAAAWLGQDDDQELTLPTAEYPRLTMVSGGQVNSVPLPAPTSRRLRLEWIESAPQQIAAHLAEKLRHGGCAAVICNRVQRAQDIYQALQDTHLVEAENLMLFHARFPFHWREEIENKVLKKFGKDKDHPDRPNPDRPYRAVVVATQVIEQSLDLDFDYMVSDLAPVDLLLQRAGRLQRHSQNDAGRPVELSQPVMAIAQPAEKDNLPDFGRDVRVYDEATLLRTWLTLRGRQEITLPQETVALIEQVYPLKQDDESFETLYQAALRAATEKAWLDESKDVHAARQRLIARPTYEGLMTERNEELEEDDPKVGQAFRALTRQGEPSLSLICLYDTPQGVALDPDGNAAPLDLNKRPDLPLAKELLRRAVSVQRREVVKYILSHDNRTSAWKKSAAVGDHFPIVFDANGEYHPDGAGFALKLSRELGLQVFKNSKEAQ